ncbi:hypothetical protein ACFYW6_38890 [Streptomyces sp. NPDC002659]|uniref:hypothetical protein n=1 Tax=Streptomyces sp. NPDC002659 TaxID=3364656 RepID=UPI00369D18CD
MTRNSGSLRSAYLHSPAYRLGDLCPIDELGQDLGVLEEMRALGLATYSRFGGDPLELAADSLHSTLRASAIRPSEIEAVIYATTAYGSMGAAWSLLDTEAGLRKLLGRLGMHRAMPIGVSLAQCANLTSAISLAAGLVSAGRYRNILVFVADRIPSGVSRVVNPGTTVLSDGAASCIVSRTAHGGWELAGFAEHLDPPDDGLNPQENFFAYLKGTAAGIEAVCADLYEQLAVDADDFDLLLINNVNRSVVRLFAEHSGFPVGSVHSANIARYGHCDAADVIINLSDHAGGSGATPGEWILILTSAPFARRAIALRAAES